MGLAAFTQLLMLVGLDLNLWNQFIWLFGGIVQANISVWTSLIAFIAYDLYWSVSTDSADAKQADAVIAIAGMKQDMLIHSVFTSAAGLILWSNYDAWAYSEYLFLSEKKQKEYVELWDGDHTKIPKDTPYIFWANFFSF